MKPPGENTCRPKVRDYPKKRSFVTMSNDKQEAVFDLVKSMSKAEKRHFKLFASRTGGGQSKFVALFDAMDSMEQYDNESILAICPVKREQLPNMKAHLYKQILVSLRLLGAHHSPSIELREQVDFAHILYDKGLYRQSSRFLEKALARAMELQERTVALNIIDFQRLLETLSIAKDMSSRSDLLSRQSSELCAEITHTNEMANVTVQLYDLYQKLGYARTQKDLDVMEQYFAPRLAVYDPSTLGFLDRFHYYEGMAWYSYMRHDFVASYRYGRAWVELFDSNPQMKRMMYYSYLKGYSRILDGLFLMRKHRLFVEKLEAFERECAGVGSLNDNAEVISRHILYTSLINRYFIEGRFREGMAVIPRVESYLQKYDALLGVHHKMMLNYKVACLCFGNADYTRCMEYLARITSRKDPRIRRDLQCYAKILNLIASWESGQDYNLDYQIRSVYIFLRKMNDLGAVQKEMLAFLKKLGTIYQSDLNSELKVLYDKLKPYENHPYERRTFYYLDILSWLESKLTGKSVAAIIRQRFLSKNH